MIKNAVSEAVRRRRQTMDLRQRVEALEEEVQECRDMNRRVAELVDVISELTIPMAMRDQEGLEELLKKYRQSL